MARPRRSAALRPSGDRSDGDLSFEGAVEGEDHLVSGERSRHRWNFTPWRSSKIHFVGSAGVLVPLGGQARHQPARRAAADDRSHATSGSYERVAHEADAFGALIGRTVGREECQLRSWRCGSVEPLLRLGASAAKRQGGLVELKESGTTREHAEPPEFRYTKHEARQRGRGISASCCSITDHDRTEHCCAATELAQRIWMPGRCSAEKKKKKKKGDRARPSRAHRPARRRRARVVASCARGCPSNAPECSIADHAKGLLHGIPMGVKDIIDSYDQPTTYGSPIYQTHQPLADAATMALARERRRAILLGKTVTTEFANRHPGPTKNPHNPAHTPGGSSSGSAAAVADFQVVLATGTQTGGSVIRPGRLLRRRGLQAELRPLRAGRHEGQHRMAGHDRRLCARSVEDIAPVPRRADGDALSADRQARPTAARRRLPSRISATNCRPRAPRP